MKPIFALITDIEYATPKELGALLEATNKAVFAANGWNAYAVRAFYYDLKESLDHRRTELALAVRVGTLTMKSYGKAAIPTAQMLGNIECAFDFFSDPPIVENPKEPLENEETSTDATGPIISESAESISDVPNAILEPQHQEAPQDSPNVRNGYAFGYKGIMEVFGWGRTKTSNVLKEEKYAAAIEQDGKKIAVNIEMMRELLRLSNKKKGAPRRK